MDDVCCTWWCVTRFGCARVCGVELELRMEMKVEDAGR